MNTARGDNGHRGVGHLPLEWSTVVVVSTHNCCTGENGGVEVFLGSGWRTRGAGGRVGQIRKTELLRYCVGNIDIW